MPHATILKFGFPDSLVHDGRCWCVLLRPAQVTLGSLVLCCKEEVTSFSTISASAFAEFPDMIRGIEATLGRFNPYDRINYLMLMMVDPHVHFHVIPRYATAQVYAGQEFPDAGWPGPPALQAAITPGKLAFDALRTAITSCWPGTAA
jgi:diadenosine tetraphosphate (Ap4A) HIT family hydrolase